MFWKFLNPTQQGTHRMSAKRNQRKNGPIKSKASFHSLPIKWLIPIWFVGFVIYLNSLQAPFNFDSVIFIKENPDMHSLFDLNALWRSNPSRFLVALTFAAFIEARSANPHENCRTVRKADGHVPGNLGASRQQVERMEPRSLSSPDRTCRLEPHLYRCLGRRASGLSSFVALDQSPSVSSAR